MADNQLRITELAGAVLVERQVRDIVYELQGQVLVSLFANNEAPPITITELQGQVLTYLPVPVRVSRLRGSALVSEAERVISEPTGTNLKRQQY